MKRFVEVNEAAIFATGTASAWWVLFEGHQPSNRITVMTASIGGHRVRVECDDDEHAEQFVKMLIEHGVPKNAVKPVPVPRLGHEHRCPLNRFAHCRAHQAGKPKTRRCPGCGSPWSVHRGTYGVFTWLGDGRYPIARAHGTFATERAAYRLADRHPTENWVVRFIDEHSL